MIHITPLSPQYVLIAVGNSDLRLRWATAVIVTYESLLILLSTSINHTKKIYTEI